MGLSINSSERVTAIASTLVAIAILAAGVTGQQSVDTPQDKLALLESDLRFQLDMSFRHDASQRAEKLAQVEQAIKAWQESPQTASDRRLFADWLLQATIHSMPGADQILPEVPKFSLPVAKLKPKNETTEVEPRSVETQQAFATETEPHVPQPPTNTSQAELATQHVEEQLPSTESTASITPISDYSKLAESTSSAPVAVSSSIDTSPVADTSLPALPLQQEEPLSSPPEQPVQINLTELAARIAGYHEGLDAVEKTLYTLNGPDLIVLSKQIRDLEAIARDLRFVKLYYESLTEQERQAVPAPRPIQSTLAKIERQLEKSETPVGGDFLKPFDATDHARITRLRKKLATIANRVK